MSEYQSNKHDGNDDNGGDGGGGGGNNDTTTNAHGVGFVSRTFKRGRLGRTVIYPPYTVK